MYRNLTLLVALIGIVISSGCAELDQMQAGLDQLQVKGVVRGNVFYSKSPRLELKVDGGLNLMATVEEDIAPGKNSYENDKMENTTKYASYIFGDADSTSAVTRGVIIRTRTSIGNPNQELLTLKPDRGNELVSGMTKILGDEYYSYALASDNLLTAAEQRTLSERNISGCLLVKGLERDFGLGGKSLLQILYFERIEAAETASQCGSWLDPSALSDEQKGLLAAFLDRSYQGIRFVKGGEVKDTTAKYVDRDKNSDAATQSPPPAAAPLSGDIEERLQTLKNLRDKDLITQEEYESKKAEILQGL